MYRTYRSPLDNSGPSSGYGGLYGIRRRTTCYRRRNFSRPWWSSLSDFGSTSGSSNARDTDSPEPQPHPTEPRPVPADQDITTEAEKEVLKLKETSLEVQTNATSHHTDKYEITDPDDNILVIRRGQEFLMELTFDRPYDKEKDDIKVVFKHAKTGGYAKPIKKKLDETERTVMPDNEKYKPRLIKKDGNKIQIGATFEADSWIGKWSVTVQVKFKQLPTDKMESFSQKVGKLYLLFNPWCKDDETYMEDEKLLEEYILNDTGIVYRSGMRPGKPWNFGQFEDFMLDNVVKMLITKSGIKATDLGDAAMVSRALASMINVQDEGGVLSGNWSGKYDGGTSPLAWAGSVKILEEYFLKNKMESSVKFGQCWVFSGVMVSVCRCLGLPCRSVTNYGSAHDGGDINCTIDEYRNEKGEKVGGDSVWNFHVWNECWMARPDLGEKDYGGWQVVDSTPQETSDGVYTCGPCPVKAVKYGSVRIPHDTHFVFGEVNGDKVTHKKNPVTGHFEVVRILKDSVGTRTITKDPEREWHISLTDDYKFKEGSGEERAAVWNAVRARGRENFEEVYNVEDQGDDIKFKVQETEDLKLGDNLTISVQISNTASECRHVEFETNLSTVFYNGVVGDKIKKETFDLEMAPNSEETVSIPVSADEYLSKLVDRCMFKVESFGRVVETKQTVFDEDEISLIKPTLEIKCPDTVKSGETFKVIARFNNPLKEPLTKCYFELEGAGLTKPEKHELRRGVGPGQEASVSAVLTAKKPGKKVLIVNFESKQLSELTEKVNVEVQ